MKSVFVSHPYSDCPELRKKQVDIICKDLSQRGFFPLSPLHMFSFYEKDSEEVRDRIMVEICPKLMEMSDVCFFYKYKLIGANTVSLSSGQSEEWVMALEQAVTRYLQILDFAVMKDPLEECLKLQEDL